MLWQTFCDSTGTSTVSVGEPLHGKPSYDAFVKELEASMNALAKQEKLPEWD